MYLHKHQTYDIKYSVNGIDIHAYVTPICCRQTIRLHGSTLVATHSCVKLTALTVTHYQFVRSQRLQESAPINHNLSTYY